MKAFKAIPMVLLFVLFLPAFCFAEAEMKVSSKDNDLQADYDSVWSAAIDTLYQMNLPISFMSKSDGYMVTGMKVIDMKVEPFSANGRRVMFMMRFVKKDNSIIARISSGMERMHWTALMGYEKSRSLPDYRPFYVWEPVSSDDSLEKLLAKEIALKIKLP